MTVEARSTSKVFTRREALRITLAASSLLVASGCRIFQGGSKSDLDQAYEDLQAALAGIAESDVEGARLTTIARHIERTSKEILADHGYFLDAFNKLANQRDVSTEDLEGLIARNRARRMQFRLDLLRLQDALRAELTPEEWSQVAQVLNRKAATVARSGESKG